MMDKEERKRRIRQRIMNVIMNEDDTIHTLETNPGVTDYTVGLSNCESITREFNKLLAQGMIRRIQNGGDEKN